MQRCLVSKRPGEMFFLFLRKVGACRRDFYGRSRGPAIGRGAQGFDRGVGCQPDPGVGIADRKYLQTMESGAEPKVLNQCDGCFPNFRLRILESCENRLINAIVAEI